MYSRKSRNPSPLPGFAFALHCSWLLIQLQRGQMVYFSGQKKLSFQWHQQHAHLWSTWPSDSPRILLSPHHSPDINSLAVCSQLGTHGPSSPAEEEMMPVGASNLRRPRALPQPHLHLAGRSPSWCNAPRLENSSEMKPFQVQPSPFTNRLTRGIIRPFNTSPNPPICFGRSQPLQIKTLAGFYNPLRRQLPSVYGKNVNNPQSSSNRQPLYFKYLLTDANSQWNGPGVPIHRHQHSSNH